MEKITIIYRSIFTTSRGDDTMTREQARKYCKSYGCTLTVTGTGVDSEYRVNFRGGFESTAYYTNDLDDAVATAMAMRARGEPQPTAEQLTALARYAKANGRTWKTKLADAWLDGRDAREPDGCYLRQVRNSFGPSWLKAYRLPE